MFFDIFVNMTFENYFKGDKHDFYLLSFKTKQQEQKKRVENETKLGSGTLNACFNHFSCFTSWIDKHVKLNYIHIQEC